jgi:acetylornithine deacetylase/succinyl-diaminopimelate desuccinylase-like protein
VIVSARYGRDTPSFTAKWITFLSRAGSDNLSGRTARVAFMADTDVRRYVEAHAQEFLDQLVEWLRIPSISVDPERVGDVRRSAEWLVDALRTTGFPTVEVWETAGLPSVFAEWPAADPDATAVVVYGHHDVQPVDPLELWETPPFEPQLRGEELFARGAVDDKGQVAFHLLGLRAWLAVNSPDGRVEGSGASAPPITIKLLIEGEEESGSPNFRDLLERRLDRLDCDVVVVSDTGMWSREQ